MGRRHGGGDATPTTRPINGTRQAGVRRGTRLQHAIVDDGRSQRELSIATKIPEVRFSAIIRNVAQADATERRAISRELGRPIRYLFGKSAT
jgi:hypothetical protein